MKQYLLLLIFGMFAIANTNAQDLTIADEFLEVYEPDVTTEDVSIHTTVTNNASLTRTYVWERTIITKPMDWASAVCDTNLCYLPHIETAEFSLASGVTGPIIVHVYPDAVEAGNASVSVKVYEKGNPDVSVEAAFNFCIGLDESECQSIQVDTDDVIDLSTLSIYPNPARDYIMISQNDFVDQLTIYNIVGQPISTYQVYDGERYDVSNLSAGLYLARMTDKDGNIVKTMRVYKQ